MKNNIVSSPRARAIIGISVVMLICVLPLHGQGEEEDWDRVNSNLAIAISPSLHPTATYAGLGWGTVYGAGYNLSKHHSLIGEIMWTRFYATDKALAPIRTALQTSNINGHADLVAFTGNYRLQFEGKVYGAYLIAGAGWYYRIAALSQRITVGESVRCTPAWIWWGFTCTSGVVTSNQTLASTSSTAPGGNIGVGFTIRAPDSRYKFYVESRYHYAASRSVTTQAIPITIGIRF